MDQGNSGNRIPTMLRISGTLQTQEHRGATKIKVFFDSFI